MSWQTGQHPFNVIAPGPGPGVSYLWRRQFI